MSNFSADITTKRARLRQFASLYKRMATNKPGDPIEYP